MSVQVDIVLGDLISSDRGPGRRIGARMFWHCPFHEDGTPSLTLMPDGNRFICFGCGEMGDAIDWVRKRRGMSFMDAVESLNGRLLMGAPREPNQAVSPKPVIQARCPGTQWIAQSTSVISECAELIWTSRGRDAIAGLESRGICRDTVARWKIGYNHRDRLISGLFVRRGILIPWFGESSIRSIKIRRPTLEPKYVCVSGSCPAGLYLAQAIVPGRPTLVVEGELDALLAWQEVREIINVVTLGSASDSPDNLALKQLITSPLILLCYDNDIAGSRGIERWNGLSARTRCVHVPHGKDITDFVTLGGDLRSWVNELLRECRWESSRQTTEFKEGVTC